MDTVSVNSTKKLLLDCSSDSNSRLEFWAKFIRHVQVTRMLEVGVYRGEFAAFILGNCASIAKYYMIDPWRHLADWNKPANQDDATLESFYRETKARTDFAKDRRVVLRGKTNDMIDQIRDGELDFAYIDGDHTLKGIAVDLIRVYPKIRSGGFIGGDDFSRTIWSHKTRFEPTLVFPFAVYFAEAVGATIYAMPGIQFCLSKSEKAGFSFVDLTGQYGDLSLASQVSPQKMIKLALGEKYPRLWEALSRAARIFR